MINLTLFKREFLGTLKSLGIFLAVLTMYFIIIIKMYDPTIDSALAELFKTMPEFMASFGMGQTSPTLLGFLVSYLYGFLMLVFPMVLSILVGNKLIAKHIDKGSMAYLLAAPIKRSTVVITQAKVLLTTAFIVILFVTALGIITCEAYFPDALDKKYFLLLNLGVLCLQFFISGICFLSSCIFNDTKYSLGFGAGIPTLAYIFQMLANASTNDSKLENIKYATFFTLYNPEGLSNGSENALWGILILFIGAVLLYCLSIFIFNKKDLPI